MRRFWAVILSLALVLGAVPARAAEDALPFTDVKESDWFYEDVAAAYTTGLFKGTGDGTTFSPQGGMSRGMFVTVMGRLAGVDPGQFAVSPFPDVKIGDWYGPYVAWAAQMGVVKGYADGTFGPNDTITREQAGTIIANYLGTITDVKLPNADSVAAAYADQDAVAGWALAGVNEMRRTGLLIGDSAGNFNPSAFIDRASGATLLLCLQESLAKARGEEPSGRSFTIRFDTDGGSPVAEQKVRSGRKAIEPQNPTKAGWAFGGWFTDTARTTAYSFSGPVLRNRTLYALWLKPGNVSIKPDFSSGYTYDAQNNRYELSSRVSSLAGTMDPAAGLTSAGYEVTDVRGSRISGGDFTPGATWTIQGIGLVVGLNKLTLTVTDRAGSVTTEVFYIFNTAPENVDKSVDQGDSDGDGVINYLEALYESDPNKVDTDADGLDDYVEIATLGYDPCLKDSDGDGIPDGDEDPDLDGLSNLTELARGSNLLRPDSDGDDLLDGEEVALGTAPGRADTDGDTLSDGYEVRFGYDPLTRDDLQATVTETRTAEQYGYSRLGRAPFSVQTTAPLGQLAQMDIQCYADPYVGASPYQVGTAYTVTMKGGTGTDTVLTFPLTTQQLAMSPTLYTYDPTHQYYDKVANQSVTDAGVTAQVGRLTGSETFVLLNGLPYDVVWNTEIKSPDDESSESAGVDIAFVIDSSGSMSSNDPRGLRKTLTDGFVDEMSEWDRAAIIDFDSSSTTRASLTADKDTLKKAVSGIDANGGTHIYAGMERGLSALRAGTADDQGNFKVMFVLTDGEDDGAYHTTAEYEALSTAAAEEDQVVIYTVGLGSVNENLLRTIADNAGGQYFYATAADDLTESYEQVRQQTVAYLQDVNKDGINDYYTELMCEGTLRYGDGSWVFPGKSKDEINADDDLDDDGVKNGAEVKVVEYRGRVYVKKLADPTMPDSDFDGLPDKEELRQSSATDPLSPNVSVPQKDMDYLLGDRNFAANAYKTAYEEDALERGLVWIGNLIFNSQLGDVYNYEKTLLRYFEVVDEAASGQMAYENALVNGVQTLDDLVGDLSTVQDAAKAAGDLAQTQAAQKAIEKVVEAREKLVALDKSGTLEDVQELLNKAGAKVDELTSGAGDLVSKVTAKTGVKLPKDGKLAEKVTFGLTALSAAGDAVVTGVRLQQSLDCMDANRYVLRAIMAEPNAPTDLVSAAFLLDQSLESQMGVVAANVCNLANATVQVGLTVGMDALSGVLKTVPYVNVAMAALDVADLVLNLGGVAEGKSSAYCMGATGSILGNYMEQWVPVSRNNGRCNIYSKDGVQGVDYVRNLVLVRSLGETLMEEAAEAHVGFFEEMFSDRYDLDNIQATNAELDRIMEECGLATPYTGSFSEGSSARPF